MYSMRVVTRPAPVLAPAETSGSMSFLLATLGTCRGSAHLGIVARTLSWIFHDRGIRHNIRRLKLLCCMIRHSLWHRIRHSPRHSLARKLRCLFLHLVLDHGVLQHHDGGAPLLFAIEYLGPYHALEHDDWNKATRSGWMRRT